jgi:hypothetical protein
LRQQSVLLVDVFSQSHREQFVRSGKIFITG